MSLNQDVDFNFMKHELQTIAALGGGVLLIGFGLFGFTEGWIIAGQWLLQAGLLWAYVCLCVRRRLALNRASEETPLYGDLGWGNRLTILRGGLIALTGGFLFMDQATAGNAWAPAILYTLAAILDRLDGFVARRSRQVSLLGNELDITFDALGLVIAPLLAIGLGKLHGSYLLLSVAYYVYQWGLQRRRSLGLPVYPLPPNPLRRTLAGFQMGFIAVVFWPLLDSGISTVAGVAFMLPVLFGFVMDWRVVCGGLSSKTYNRLEAWSVRHFQPGLRVLLAQMLFLAMQNIDLSITVGWWLALCACLIFFGFAGRLGALIMIMLLGRHYPEGGIDLIGQLLIFTACWVLLLGTGRYSLWQWGDDWIKRYDGA
jgi:CDP-diacylglycerol---glycerol-3-phosphate 3-phosphatidyltransferase